MRLYTDNLPIPSFEVDMSMEEIGQAAKRFFGWRTTKGFTGYYPRLMALGSHDHDRFVEYIYQTSEVKA